MPWAPVITKDGVNTDTTKNCEGRLADWYGWESESAWDADALTMLLEADITTMEWRDTVRKGKYANGLGWLMFSNNKVVTDIYRRKSDALEKLDSDRIRLYETANREPRKILHRGVGGKFTSPLRLIHGKTDSYTDNFPQGISPRLINIIDYITNNPHKWQKGFMAQFTAGYPKDFNKDFAAFLNRPKSEKLDCNLYEVFRVITTDNDFAYCVKQMYSMGVGLKSLMTTEMDVESIFKRPMSNISNLQHSDGSFKHRFDSTGGINIRLLKYATDSLKSCLFDYGVFGDKIHDLQRGMTGNNSTDREPIDAEQFSQDYLNKLLLIRNIYYPMEEYYAQSLAEGESIFKIPLSKIVMKTADMNPIAVMKQTVQFGDYVCLVGAGTEVESGFETYNYPVMTLDGIGTACDHRKINEIIFSPETSGSFIHLSQMDGAFGVQRKRNYRELSDQKNIVNISETSIEMHQVKGLLPNKSMKMMEPMTPHEYVCMMTGIGTAQMENFDIGGIINEDGNVDVEIKFVPSWKDNRKTVVISLGTAYSDIIRCEQCNQKVLVKLPVNNVKEELPCPQCNTIGGLKTSHLVEGNPSKPINGPNKYR